MNPNRIYCTPIMHEDKPMLATTARDFTAHDGYEVVWLWRYDVMHGYVKTSVLAVLTPDQLIDIGEYDSYKIPTV